MNNISENIIDQKALNKKLLQLKSFGSQISDTNSDEISVEMFLVDFDTKNKKERIKDIKKLKISKTLQDTLRENVINAINSRDEISALLDINIESNEHFYYESQIITEYEQVEIKILECSESITKPEEINEYNAYIVRVIVGKTSEREEISLNALTYFASGWKLKYIKSFFLGNAEAHIKPYEAEFKIYDYVSFFSIDSQLFISNVNHFQTVMNYTQRLKEKKVETANSLEEHNVISSSGKKTLLDVIGHNKTMMKQLASVQRQSHYKNPTFSAQLYQKIHKEEYGTLEFDDNKMIIVKNDKDYIKEMLTLLQDKRVITLILETLSDVDGNLSALTKKPQSVTTN